VAPEEEEAVISAPRTGVRVKLHGIWCKRSWTECIMSQKTKTCSTHMHKHTRTPPHPPPQTHTHCTHTHTYKYTHTHTQIVDRVMPRNFLNDAQVCVRVFVCVICRKRSSRESCPTQHDTQSHTIKLILNFFLKKAEKLANQNADKQINSVFRYVRCVCVSVCVCLCVSLSLCECVCV
jgi:hypothetical protein